MCDAVHRRLYRVAAVHVVSIDCSACFREFAVKFVETCSEKFVRFEGCEKGDELTYMRDLGGLCF